MIAQLFKCLYWESIEELLEHISVPVPSNYAIKRKPALITYRISLNAEITNFSHNLRIDGLALGRHVTPHMKAYVKGYPIATPTRWHAPSKKGKNRFL